MRDEADLGMLAGLHVDIARNEAYRSNGTVDSMTNNVDTQSNFGALSEVDDGMCAPPGGNGKSFSDMGDTGQFHESRGLHSRLTLKELSHKGQMRRRVFLDQTKSARMLIDENETILTLLEDIKKQQFKVHAHATCTCAYAP